MRYLVHHLLRDAAVAHPERVAVVDGDRSYTYARLEEASDRLAHLLVGQGVRRGDRVGIYLVKSLESVVAVYGIMKTGAAYVPLDPDAPVARLGYIARDCSLRCLVSGAERADAAIEVAGAAPAIEAIVLMTGDERSAPVPVLTADAGGAVARFESVEMIDQDLAYILYTSGSTGDPKGVMLTHRNAMAFVEWAVEQFALDQHDRLSSFAPLHFDLSIFDLFAAASSAAAVVLVPSKAVLFPRQVVAFAADARITVWYSVPSILTMVALRGGLSTGALPDLRAILFAGEVFPTKYLRELMAVLPHVRFANLYGPTETNVCTWHDVAELDGDEPVPIGRAIANDQVYALTDDGRVAGPGEVGELLVRGATVMRGYWNDPERTQRTLVADPVDPMLADPVYRTGDLVALGADGSYRYVGRRDAQVKSRGYRIELGDVETAVNAHPAVVECAVVAVADELVTNRIVCFVVADGLERRDLTEFCHQRIPHYMVPEAFTFLSELPKTSTGKIDRRALAGHVQPPGSR